MANSQCLYSLRTILHKISLFCSRIKDDDDDEPAMASFEPYPCISMMLLWKMSVSLQPRSRAHHSNCTKTAFECDPKKMKLGLILPVTLFFTQNFILVESCLCSLLIAAGKFTVRFLENSGILNV